MGEQGDTRAAGEGVSDDEFRRQVAEQSSSDLKEADVFKRESDGTSTDVEAAKASADDLDSPA